MKIMGVDPGRHGAVSLVEMGEIMFAFEIPYTKDGIPDADRLHKTLEDFKIEPDLVVVENVHAIFGASAKATFNFGRSFGYMLGFFLGLKYKVGLAAPKEWQAYAHQGIEGVKSAKERSLIASKKFFPHENFCVSKRSKKPHDGLIDASLIALYGEFLLRDFSAMAKGRH